MREQLPEEKQYNREAMAKVRADVKAFVEAGQTNGMDHLGQYPQTMEDAVRTIIALQDLLDRSIHRHQLATAKVFNLKQQLKALISIDIDIIKNATINTKQASDKIIALTKTNKYLTDECKRLSDGWDQVDILLSDETSAHLDTKEELAAALTTLKTVMK